jgi:hypothetical protein
MYLSQLISDWKLGKEIPELSGHYCCEKYNNDTEVEIQNVDTGFKFVLSQFLYNCSFIILGNIDNWDKEETKDSIKAVLTLLKNLDYTGLILTSIISSHKDYLIKELGFKLLIDVKSNRTDHQNYFLMKEL